MILKLNDFFNEKKNKKWLFVILIIAVVMLIATSVPQREKKEVEFSDNFEENLEKALSKMAGVGKAEVLIKYSKTEEKVLAKNIKDDGERHEEQIANINSGGVTLYEHYPKIEGIVVICDGGASSAVRTNVLKAVAALTGLSSKSIGVFKGA